jgi:hypothetical protein
VTRPPVGEFALVSSVGRVVILQLSIMRCVHCSADPMRIRRRRKFPHLETEYLICETCNRAQRRPSGLKTRGRGKRSADREALRASLAVASATVKFKILVYGPDPKSSNPASPTRKEILDELRRLGHDVYFPEELTVAGLPTNVLELRQLKKVQLVINLAASPGSQAEFENYGVTLGKRLLVFLDGRAKGGFTDTGTRVSFRLNGGMDEFFDEDDLKTGALVLAAADWISGKVHLQELALSVMDDAEKSLL